MTLVQTDSFVRIQAVSSLEMAPPARCPLRPANSKVCEL